MGRMAIYPGSFDPITNGHLSILRRGLTIFDSITIAVASNPRKQCLFSMDERIDMIRESMSSEPQLVADRSNELKLELLKRDGC